MKRKVVFFILLSFFFLSGSLLYAHTPIVEIIDNEDGTITLECGFSNGASAAGVKIILAEKEKYEGKEKIPRFKKRKILFEGRLDKFGCLTIIKPETPDYLVYMNAGFGHVVFKEGPPLTEEERANWEELKEKYEEGVIPNE